MQEIVLKLYQNVEMGIVGIESIEEKITNRSLAKVVLNQKEEYQKKKQHFLKYCKNYNVEDKELSPMAKIMSEMMSKMKLLKDHKDTAIAKMLMEGTNKGLIELEELKNKCRDESLQKEITDLIKLEQQNNEELKIYL